MPEPVTYQYIPFTGKGDASRRIVEGYISSPAVDCDEQIVDQEWLKSELPEWLLRYGNIREQHNPQRAVGRAQAVDVEAQPGPYLSAKIVDDEAWRKVQAGVYTGFSVGIKAPRIVHDGSARNGRIAGGKRIEISIVDRPANEAAKFVVLKRAGDREWKDVQTGVVMEETAQTGDEEKAVTSEQTAAATGPESVGAGDGPKTATGQRPAEPPAGADRPLSARAPATERRPGTIGEVMAMLKEVQARVEALAAETDRDHDGDIDSPASMEPNGPAGETRPPGRVRRSWVRRPWRAHHRSP